EVREDRTRGTVRRGPAQGEARCGNSRTQAGSAHQEIRPPLSRASALPALDLLAGQLLSDRLRDCSSDVLAFGELLEIGISQMRYQASRKGKRGSWIRHQVELDLVISGELSVQRQNPQYFVRHGSARGDPCRF